MASPSGTETVIKRILPYLRRRGYDETTDFEFEVGATYTDRYDKGFIDILVTCGQPNPLFLVEAKRISRSLTKRDHQQALDYGRGQEGPVRNRNQRSGRSGAQHQNRRANPLGW